MSNDVNLITVTPEAEKIQIERQCIIRMLIPEDIAKTVLFFASEHTNYIHSDTNEINLENFSLFKISIKKDFDTGYL